MTSNENWTRALRVVLAAILGFTGIAKLLGGHASWMMLPAWAHHSIGVLELCLAIALAAGRVVTPALAVILISAGGLLVAWLAPGKSCGCAGTWLRFSEPIHLVFACSMGTLAGLMVMLEGARRAASPADDASPG